MITKQRGRNQLGSGHVGGWDTSINQLEHLILPMRYSSLIQYVCYLILVCITTITTYVISKGDQTCGCEWLMKVKFTLKNITRHQMSPVFYFPDDLHLDRKNKSPGSSLSPVNHEIKLSWIKVCLQYTSLLICLPQCHNIYIYKLNCDVWTLPITNMLLQCINCVVEDINIYIQVTRQITSHFPIQSLAHLFQKQ